MMAGKKLLEKLGAVVMEGAAIVDLPELGGLPGCGKRVASYTLVDFAGHWSTFAPARRAQVNWPTRMASRMRTASTPARPPDRGPAPGVAA